MAATSVEVFKSFHSLVGFEAIVWIPFVDLATSPKRTSWGD
jgi:hypothetical protein